MPSETIQDYLKTIYRLGGDRGESVSPGEVANSLGVTPATATIMIQRLHNSGEYVEYQKRVGAKLTSKGRREALRILRRHRLIELFLVQILGFGWEEVHSEAERLEHALSDRVIERLAVLLGNPQYDPHGTPIPDAKGKMPIDERIPLSKATEGSYIVLSIGDIPPSLRATWSERGLRPGTPLTLLAVDPSADLWQIELNSNTEKKKVWSLGSKVAEAIHVRAI
ncbi:MAG: metal-dependent transcriptional regulator [Chthoniobacterales bacterium]|nr:metal-dependent transcriptional regulator [Chthoniobacterales bacterium]